MEGNGAPQVLAWRHPRARGAAGRRIGQTDLLNHAPDGVESLAALAARVRSSLAEPAPAVQLVVLHGGWLNAWLHVAAGATALAAMDWPPAPKHMSLVRGA